MRLIERVRRALRGADEIVATDRYGGHWPDPQTVCEGPCEGMGIFPLYSAEGDTRKDEAGHCAPVDDDTVLIRAMGGTPGDDGWCFVTCPECDGSGKRKVAS